MPTRPWLIHVNKEFLTWIRGHPSFHAFVEAAEGVIALKETFNKYGMASCMEGVLVPVKGEDVALRVVIRSQLKELHIVGTKPLFVQVR